MIFLMIPQSLNYKRKIIKEKFFEIFDDEKIVKKKMICII